MSRQTRLRRAGALIRPAVGGVLSPARVGTTGRGFVKAGTRWVWLADLAWGLAIRLTREQVAQYLDARVGQGFTAVAFAAMRRTGIGPGNIYGAEPYVGSLSSPSESYWTHVDYVIEQITARGLVALVDPAWAAGQQGSVLTVGNAYGYGSFLAQRYLGNDGVVWLLGGGEGAGGFETVWRNLAAGLDSASTTNVAGYHPAVAQTSTTWFDLDAWPDFHVTATGGCLVYATDRTLEGQAYANAGGRPWVAGEPPFEAAPICGNLSAGRHTPLAVRRGIYWGLFAGAAGVAYGHNATVLFESRNDDTAVGNLGPWTSYLTTEGATQMRHVRTLVESRPRCEPRSTLVSNPGSGVDWSPAMTDSASSTLMVYFANGGSRTVSLDTLAGSTCRPWWFNPRAGTVTQQTDRTSSGTVAFTAPTSAEDWVLVIDNTAAGYGPPGTLTAPAPTVSAGSDVTGHPVGTLFTRTATESGASITARSWSIVSGPSGAGSTIGSAAALSWTPTGTGTYVLRYAATNAGGTGTDDMSLSVTSVALLPWQVHNIGTGSGTGKVHMAVDVARVSTGSRQLYETSAIVAGLEIDPEYMVTADNQWVQMATRVDAPTTSGSSYARCEYREVTSGWGFNPHDNGTHWARARVKMTSIPTDKPDLIFGQLHSSEDDVIQLQTNRTGGQIATRLRLNGALVYTFAASYSTGTVVDYLMEVLPAVGSQPARCRLYYNDLVIPAYTFAVSEMPTGSGYYWKVGNYCNSNETTESDSTRWGITHVRHIQHFHTGWQTPQNYFGIPEVSAGSDTSATHSTTFDRTATETGSGITARKWGIVDGPTGRGTTIGSTAALSWSVPSSTGVYRLRYGAQNTSGWGVDDVLITVT